jgi:hypothetical protein
MPEKVYMTVLKKKIAEIGDNWNAKQDCLI